MCLQYSYCLFVGGLRAMDCGGYLFDGIFDLSGGAFFGGVRLFVRGNSVSL
jgi:hypothetical protein